MPKPRPPPKKKSNTKKPPFRSKTKGPLRRSPTKGGRRPDKKPARPKPSPVLAALGPDTIRPYALAAVEAALDKKAENPMLLDVRRISSYADYVLVLSAESERQLDAIAREIEQRVEGRGGRLRSIESAGESNWLLMDFGDLIVHIFFRDARGFYDLEGLWSDAPRVPLAAQTGVAAR